MDQKMNKADREIFQRNMMITIKLVTFAYDLQDPVNNLRRAIQLLKEAQDLVQGEINEQTK